MHRHRTVLAAVVVMSWVFAVAVAQEPTSPRMRDRGNGQPTSMFNTFIAEDEWLVYAFFEAYVDADMEYKPAELGHDLDQDFRGEYFATEELLYVAYGVRDWLALELEAAVIQAELTKNDDDSSTLPDKLEESGLGDVEGQLRWRYAPVTDTRPEYFGYFEWVAPTQDEGALIGTTDWEFKFGSGLIRSFEFGTLALRAAVEYDTAESEMGAGELALEYMRRLQERTGIYAGIEGSEDEFELIGELQWEFRPRAVLKLGTGVGLTSKATDFAPEIGVLFRF